jgi:aspartyl/glutamyl-tRNA(Asn/Gln) amidotransferase C subunit
MEFTEKDLDNLSALARIDILPSEKEKMLHDMQSILGYISEINNIGGTTETRSEVVFNVVRNDVITHETGSNTEVLLAEAPETENGYVKVEQVMK